MARKHPVTEPPRIGPQNRNTRAINDAVAQRESDGLGITAAQPNAPGAGTEDRPAKKRRNPFRSTLTDEQRENARKLIKADPEATNGQIAKAIGCPTAAIAWMRERYEVQHSEGETIADRALREYGSRLHRRLPFKTRVRLYSDIARGKIDAKRAFSALKSLQRVEELEGIVTRREQKEAEGREAPKAPSAVFVIQGAQISVGADMNQAVTKDASKQSVALLPATDAEPEGSTS